MIALRDEAEDFGPGDDDPQKSAFSSARGHWSSPWATAEASGYTPL